ncbi:MAG: hypothetical protein GKS00_04955 [Alphaproteobacteria bacterium]|nr:hypothetical protein [Alphaproteobacteria bacterium]
MDFAMPIRLLSWNIRHGGGARVARIHAAIRVHRAEIVVLTEFRDNPPGRTLREALAADGLVHQATSAPPPRVNGVLIASSRPFSLCDEGSDVPADRHRWVTVQFADFGLTGTYFPSLHAKLPHWDYMLRIAARYANANHLVVGDFNTGKNYVDESGTVFHYGDYLDRMEAAGWPEAWRALHPAGRQYSWYSHKGNGFRIDHAYLSPRLIPALRAARYRHRDRKNGTSDHSALIVELEM